jgi:hypothetical protein
MDLLFYMAGVALLAHIALCLLLQHGLIDDPTVLRELFVTPNKWAVGNSRFQLLRARYYLPWRSVPGNLQSMSRGQRALFRLAQVTGLLMPLCALASTALDVIRASA